MLKTGAVEKSTTPVSCIFRRGRAPTGFPQPNAEPKKIRVRIPTETFFLPDSRRAGFGTFRCCQRILCQRAKP